MQISALFQRYGRDLGYLLVILGLLAFIWKNELQSNDWSELVKHDLVASKEIVVRYNEVIFSQIERTILENEPYNYKRYEKRPRLAKKAVEKLNHHATSLIASLWANNPEKTSELKRNLKTAELTELNAIVYELRDSLHLYVDHEPRIVGMIDQIFGLEPSNPYWTVAKELKTRDTGLFLQDLILRGELAYTVTLKYLSAKTAAETSCLYWFPVISATKSAILPGQTYTADIFMAQYTKSYMYQRNTTIKVNGKPFPINDGLARYTHRFFTPGEKKLSVDVEINNPVTNMKESYKKDFYLRVVDTCQ